MAFSSATSEPGLCRMYTSACFASSVSRGSATISRAPRRWASNMRMPMIGWHSVVLVPIAKMGIAGPMSCSSLMVLVIAPEPNAVPRPDTSQRVRDGRSGRVVGADHSAHELLHQVVLFVGAAGRAECRQGVRAVVSIVSFILEATRSMASSHEASTSSPFLRMSGLVSRFCGPRSRTEVALQAEDALVDGPGVVVGGDAHDPVVFDVRGRRCSPDPQ